MRERLADLAAVLADLPRWALVVATAGAVAVGAVVALAVVSGGGDDDNQAELTPVAAGVQLCVGGGVEMDAAVPSEATWTGSEEGSTAEMRCRWTDVDADAVAARFDELGYDDVEVTGGVSDFLGRDDAWVVTATGSQTLPDMSASAVQGASELDVVVGATIHVHSDGTPHVHDGEG
jgi:hypothetical protein